ISDYAFSWDARYESEKREYCVQYRESDFDFITRLAAEAGVFWYFEFSEDKHTLIFCDATSKLPAAKQLFPYNALSGGDSEVPFVRSFSYAKQLASAKAELKDYSFKKPAYSFLQTETAKRLAFHQAAAGDKYEHFDYPGRYKDDAQGGLFTPARLQALRNDTETAVGQSSIVTASAGVKVNLAEHPDTAFNRDWLLVAVKHHGVQGAAAEETNNTTPTQYQNGFHAIEGNLPWLAMPKTKPLVTGPHMATVVGPKNEEIFCDKYGRVKVQFPWDRYGQANEHSSCWVRVSQGWAGGQYGFMAIPRIGHEVIVSFLEGDPDQPIITGRTYHAANPTPYLLPNHKTRTLFKTQTHKGEGFNELRFEDEASREQIYLHAQKDMDSVINNIKRTEIGLDEHITIGQDQFQLVKNNRHTQVAQDDIAKTDRDHQLLVGRNFIHKIIGAMKRYIGGGLITRIDGGNQTNIAASDERIIGADLLIKVGNASSQKAKTIVLDAGQELTIKGPGGFIKLDSGGVTISGNKVKLNEGGSPGTATEPKAVDPEAPAEPTKPDLADRR
ncbi:type VI secretion system Vgr family protein, partial [Shewanella algae]|uniref:type VI secretion system Vgr family protein n=1 Tax=Shewanella algae TaxID=38313 RepID=UPI000B8AB913